MKTKADIASHKSIRVLSLDFDGCLRNRNYLSSKELDIIESNRPFLDELIQQNKNFEQVYTIIGSNRQSFATDYQGSLYGKNEHSCFHAMPIVNHYLGTKLDSFLLADVFGNLEQGASYNLATNHKSSNNHCDWMFDENKVTVLYAQMHKFANEHPYQSITFDFYEDISDILAALQKFYGKYPDFIPKNVTLRLHQYAGETALFVKQIEGTGMIDTNFKNTVKHLSYLAYRKKKYDPNVDISIVSKYLEAFNKAKNIDPSQKLFVSEVDPHPIRTRVPFVPAASMEQQSTLIEGQSSSMKDQSTLIEEQSSSMKDQSTLIEEQSTSMKDQSTLIEEQSTSIEDQPTVIQGRVTPIENQPHLHGKNYVNLGLVGGSLVGIFLVVGGSTASAIGLTMMLTGIGSPLGIVMMTLGSVGVINGMSVTGLMVKQLPQHHFFHTPLQKCLKTSEKDVIDYQN